MSLLKTFSKLFWLYLNRKDAYNLAAGEVDFVYKTNLYLNNPPKKTSTVKMPNYEMQKEFYKDKNIVLPKKPDYNKSNLN